MSKNWIFSAIALIIISMLNYNPAKAENAEKKITILPKPDLAGEMTLETAISNRRSIRSYSGKGLDLKQVSQLLWAGQGITNSRGYRAAPSAGALYPLEIYVAKEDGLFRYIPHGHKLEKLSANDIRPALGKAAFSQSSVSSAAIDIIICAVYDRVTSKYGQRGIRYTDIEVGHAAENIHLQAVALGLASVPVGAFDDQDVAKILSLPENEIPLYIVPVGYKR